MAQERPASRGPSIFSDDTEPFRPQSPELPQWLMDEVNRPEDEAAEDGLIEWDTPIPAENMPSESAEPDSSSSWGFVEPPDDFSGPADSTSWWNFEDDTGDGPVDSTTP